MSSDFSIRAFRARTSQFGLFEFILLLKLNGQFPVERFEPTLSQSAVPPPLLKAFGGYKSRKGTTGVSTTGVAANDMFCDTGTFWALPLTYFDLPRRAGAYLFLQSVENRYFPAAPVVSTPLVRNRKAFGSCESDAAEQSALWRVPSLVSVYVSVSVTSS